MSDYEQQQGALERLGIPVETIPPENVLTSGQARSIRFRVSRPQGYAYGDVESFIFEYLLPTLEWYANALHQRDLAVHKLGELADILEVNNMNLQAQLDNKEYNEALGIAIEEDEKSSDIDILIARIKELEAQIASGGAPEEGEYYSREEVEQYIAAAEEAAAANATAAATAGYQQQLSAAVAEAVAAKEAELSQQQPEGYYTAEQVQTILEENAGYSAEQVTQIVEDARADLINSGQYFTQADVDKAVAAAVSNVESTQTGYSEEEVAAQIAAAVEAKEAEILASLPEDVKPKDPLDEITDEGDLPLRAQVKTLNEAVAQFEVYTRQLEEYIAHLEGGTPEKVDDTPRTPDGRPLPRIRPEDL